MRAGVFLGYWPWLSPDEQIELAVLADRLGLDSVWVAEAWGQDVVSTLGVLAARTERIALGSGLMQIPARQPTAAAMAAASLQVWSGGRFRLGLGVSGPQVSEGWYGMPFARPVARTREYVEIVRKTLRGERVESDGRSYPLPMPGGTGLGKPLRLLAEPVEVPIYLGAVGPKAVEQVGEIADGWLPFLVEPSQADVLLDPLKRGLARAGRGTGEIDVAASVPIGLSDDLGEARNAVRPLLTFYLGAMGAREKNFYVELADRAGHGEAAREVQERFLARDRMGAAMALTDELIDTMALVCRPTDFDARLEAFAATGVTTLVGFPCGPDRTAIVRALAAATVGAGV